MVKTVSKYLLGFIIVIVFLFIAFLFLFGKKFFTLEDPGVVTLIETSPLEQIVGGKRYSIKLYHSAHALSNDYYYFTAVDTNGKIHYKAGMGEAGATPNTAEVLFRDDGMVELYLTIVFDSGKVQKDTLRFKPEWRPISDWQ